MPTKEAARQSLMEQMGNPHLTSEEFNELDRRLKLLDSEE